MAFAADLASVEERLATVRDADIDFLLDVPVEVALARLRWRGRLDVDETAEILFRLRSAYLTLAATSDRTVVVDAAAATVPAVLAHVTSFILQRSVKGRRGLAKTTATRRVGQSLV
jgi:thymidylate kinase